jgi:hypothetical protein
MQTETPKEEEKGSVKLGRLADDINNEHKNSVALAGDAVRSGVAAVKAAIRAGAFLTNAKDIVPFGKWEKWLSDNCPGMSHDKASRWMRLSKNAHVQDLKKAKSLRAAYLAVGILHENEKETKGIGTATVDIFDELLSKFDRLSSVIDITSRVDPQDMPHDTRVAVLARVEPMLQFAAKIKAVEAA